MQEFLFIWGEGGPFIEQYRPPPPPPMNRNHSWIYARDLQERNHLSNDTFYLVYCEATPFISQQLHQFVYYIFY